ncbi:hypothetical protein, partial [Haloarcula argentinensis]|uniref:hypothetical protein n=1 Tax=Haloarcula argentinensis TaxID=43776 RepID=UPI0016699005
MTDTDRKAADALLEIDDAATQRRFTRAYDSGEVDSDELSTALRRYDSLDSDSKAEYRRFTETTGDDGVGFVSELDSDQVSDFFGSTCRQASSVAATPRLRSDRFHSVAQPDALALVSGGCADDLPAPAKQRYYNKIVDAASENSDISASEIFDQVEGVSDADRRRTLKQLFADSGEDGIRLTRHMDSNVQKTFFDLGRDNRIDGFDDFDQWRSAIANAENVDAAEAGQYTKRVDRTAGREDIEDVGEILDDTVPETDAVTGESGEAASAVRYADDGAEVEMEPGQNDDYDMAVTEGEETEYVEVKTRAEDDVNYKYI